MSSSQTNEVDTYGPLGCFAVRHAHPCTARQLKAAVGEKLDLKLSSLPLFGLFEGPLGAPCRVLEDDSTVAPETKVCFQRWNVELDREAKLCRRDDQAVHLLYAEARFYVDQGRIRPSPEQAMELDSLADPSFPAERQYLELARSLPGYMSYGASGVQVKEDIVANDIQIPAGTTVTCELDMERLAIKTGEIEQVSWQWSMVNRWRTSSPGELQYEVCMMQTNAPILSGIKLHSPQAYFLRAASELICFHLNEVHQQGQGDKAPAANPRMAGKPFNPLADFLNSELYRVSFSSIEKKK